MDAGQAGHIDAVCQTMISTVLSPWAATFEHLVGAASSSLVVCSPYIGRGPCEKIIDSLRRNGRTGIEILVLTDLSRENMLSGSTDVAALVRLCEAIPRTDIRFLPSIHAKVYVADQELAIVTSGNLTQGGLTRNLEYGISVSDAALVTRIRAEILEYRAIGSRVQLPQLRVFEVIVSELSELRRNIEKAARQRLRKEFDVKLRDADEAILRVRVDGLSTHAVFADTILYVLKNGPRRTRDIYPEIQLLHPDLCDDALKLVIQGEEWSQAKWHHRVRHAQLFLARQGKIILRDGRWQTSHR